LRDCLEGSVTTTVLRTDVSATALSMATPFSLPIMTPQLNAHTHEVVNDESELSLSYTIGGVEFELNAANIDIHNLLQEHHERVLSEGNNTRIGGHICRSTQRKPR